MQHVTGRRRCDDVDMGASVERVVAAQHAKWGSSVVDADVFGTGDPEQIAALVDRFCREALGAETEDGLFYGASAGCVLGVRLRNGGEVVIKAYQQRWRAPFLRAVQTVQALVGGRGLPCATPGAGRRHSCRGARTRPWSNRSCRTPAYGRSRRRRSAGSRHPDWPGRSAPAASCTRRPNSPTIPWGGHPTASTASRTAPCSTSWARRRGPSGSTSTRSGRVAARRRGRAATRRGPHRGRRATCASRRAPRRLRLGQRGAGAGEHGHRPGRGDLVRDGRPRGHGCPTLPGHGRVRGRLRGAAGYRLDDEQWRAAGAAAVYTLAYTARCEHTLEVTGRARLDQHATHDRLADAGEALLTLRPDR